MSAAPLLQHLIDRVGAHDGYLLVLDGEGLDDLPPTLGSGSQRWTVARASTELGLRRLLWEANGAPLIVVVPRKLADKLPADLMLGARNQRVQALETSEVLSVLLGRKVHTSDQAWFNRLVLDHVDAIVTALNRRTLPTAVNAHELGELLVDVVLSHEVRTAKPGELFARWLLAPPDVEPNALRLLRQEALPRLHGDEGSLLGWGLHSPERLAELLVIGLALTVTDDGALVPDAPWKSLLEAPLFKGRFQSDKAWLHSAVTRLAKAAAAALGAHAKPYLERAEKKARDAFPASQIAHSQVLPHSFALQAHDLVQRAARGQALYASDLQAVSTHQVAPQREHELRLLRCVARLSRYLSLPDEPYTTTRAWIDAFAHTHAYADMAALRLQRALGHVAGDLREPAQRLLTAWEERRNALNERFAHFLAEDWEGRLHENGVTPVHRIAKDLLKPCVAKGESVYLVVLDGCNVPVFHELVLELSLNHQIGLDTSDQRAGLALLPSITSHSRGAIFLGGIPPDPFLAETKFHDTERKTDAARFKQNPHLAGADRALFLKGDLVEPDPLMNALRSSTPVVGVVFNAVDDQISGHNTGALMRISIDDIRFLVLSVKEALKQGRKVLVTADHGHTRWLRGDGRVGKGSASRWLPLGKKGEAPEGFVAIDTGGLGGTKGPKAFAWRMNTWLGSPHLGYHGGCSLEELVVPLVWLEEGGQPMLEPGWWHDLPHAGGPAPRAATPPPPPRQPDPVPAPEPEPVPPPAQPKPKPKPQLGLLDPADRVARYLDRAAELSLPDEVLEGLQDDQIAVLVLLRENGHMTTHDVERSVGIVLGRVNGFMSALRRLLHRAGHPCIDIGAGQGGAKTFIWKGPT